MSILAVYLTDGADGCMCRMCFRLREYARSESERSFDEVQMRRARLQSLGLAYLSPQNKSLAQSFRYMRNKPTIIAFKTPSLENCEAQINAMALAHGGGSFGGYTRHR